MDVTSSLASRFYQNVSNALRPAPAQAARPDGPSAVETAKRTVASFVETLRGAETTSQAGMVGRADPQSVVTALASAEIAVQSAISVRDKVVESYQEILRMPV